MINTRMHVLVLASIIGCPLRSPAATGMLRTVALTGQPAPGVPEGAVFNAFSGFPDLFSATPVINVSGQVAFYANLQQGGVTGVNDLGIWSEGGGPLALVAREGSQAIGVPAGTNYWPRLSSLRLNDAGEVAFSSSLTGTGVTTSNNSGLWSPGSGTLELLARSGSQAPGAPVGAVFGSGFVPLLNSAGKVAFSALLRPGVGGVTDGNRAGIWSQANGPLDLVARSGVQAPGTPIGANFGSFQGSTLDGQGRVAFVASLQLYAGGVTAANDSGVWSQRSGAVALVVREGDEAPGVGGGAMFAGFNQNLPAVNTAGQIAFSANLNNGGVTIDNNSGIWSEGRGALALVARNGDQAPGAPLGAMFGDFFDAPVINGAGQTAFLAPFEVGQGGVNANNNAAIYSEGGGSLRLVAREGSQAPGTPDGINFNFSARARTTMILNGTGHVAFFAELQGNGNAGIWAENLAGALRLIAREGELLEVAPGEFRRITDLRFGGPTGNEDGRASSFNDAGQVVFAATFTDGSAGVFVSNLAAIPEPTSLALATMTAILAAAMWRTRR